LSAGSATHPIAADEAARLFAGLANTDLLVAVSGGADSVALLWLLARWSASTARARLHVATIDHGLRPESRAEAERVADLAGALGLPHTILSWSGDKPPSGIEAAAREARYALLSRHARDVGVDHMATAHTLDDQAETVLMRLAAGSGPAGLAAMRPRVERPDGLVHVRPLLGVAKARLIATLTAEGIGWSEDAMNRDPAFARPRLRASATVLAREGLTAERLVVLARRMARAEDALAAAAGRAWSDYVSGDPVAGFIVDRAAFSLPDEIILRLLRRCICAAGGVESLRLERLEALGDAVIGATKAGARAVRTLAGARVVVDKDGVRIVPAPPRRTSSSS
jgi:tRNA(Ile)-lysidine synthase